MRCSLSRKRSVGAGTEMAITLSPKARGMAAQRSRGVFVAVNAIGRVSANRDAPWRSGPNRASAAWASVSSRTQGAFPLAVRSTGSGRRSRKPPQAVRRFDLVDEPHSLATQYRQVTSRRGARATARSSAEDGGDARSVVAAESQQALAEREMALRIDAGSPTSTRPTSSRRAVDLASPSRSPRSTRRSCPGSAAISSSARHDAAPGFLHLDLSARFVQSGTVPIVFRIADYKGP